MSASSTYREMQDRVLDLISKSDATTRNRIKNWLNMGYQHFVLRENWPFREATGTLNTVQGTQEYSLSSQFSDIDQQSISGVTVQGAAQGKLIYWPFEQLRANQPDFDSQSGVPQRYYLKAGNLGIWPVPDAVYQIFIDYNKIPTEMSADADEPIVPIAYRQGLVQFALSKEHDFNTDPDLAQKAMNEYEQIVALARNNLLIQPFDTESFKVLGPADSRSWTGLSGEIR